MAKIRRSPPAISKTRLKQWDILPTSTGDRRISAINSRVTTFPNWPNKDPQNPNLTNLGNGWWRLVVVTIHFWKPGARKRQWKTTHKLARKALTTCNQRKWTKVLPDVPIRLETNIEPARKPAPKGNDRLFLQFILRCELLLSGRVNPLCYDDSGFLMWVRVVSLAQTIQSSLNWKNIFREGSPYIYIYIYGILLPPPLAFWSTSSASGASVNLETAI